MRLQDHIVRSTQKALDDVVRAVEATEEDRLEWSPGGAARPILAQLRELSGSPDWVMAILEERGWPSKAKHGVDARSLDMAGCIEALREGTSRLCRTVSAFPDADLEVEVRLKFGPGVTMTLADVLDLHRWNLVYHLGQIGQIQLMLGDRVMH